MVDIPYPTAPQNKLMTPGENLQQMQGLVGLSQQQFELASRQLAATHQIFGAVVANPTMEQVTRSATELRNLGVAPDVIANGLGEVAGLGGDPQKIRDWAFTHLAKTMDVGQRLQASGMSAPAYHNIGGQDVPIQTRSGPQAGIGPVAGSNALTRTLTQSERAQPVTGEPDPQTGAPTTMPLGAYAEKTGVAPRGAYTAPAGGRVGSMVTGLAPGVGEAQKITGEAGGGQLAQDRTQASQFREQVFPLEKAISALETLGTTGTGPGTETLNHVKSFLLSAGVPGVDADKIKDFDEAKKYLTDYVNRTGNTGTNDKLAAAFAGNPSVNISNAAAADVSKSALALRRMQQAKVFEFEKSGLPQSEYGSWSAKWNTTQDPRAYGFDMMNATAQKKLLSSMNDSERAKFMVSLRHAHGNDLLNAPRR